MSVNKAVVCDACQQGKSHQLPFLLSTRVTTAPLEIIYSDVWGPAHVSTSGHQFYVSFIDAYSRSTWLYLLKHKSDVFKVFLQFQQHVERLLGRKIIHVQSDWGGEYHRLNQFFTDIGISHRVSYPHTHQQNGTAERKHRHIVETGLTLLAHASAPYRFWSDAFTTACFLINRLPSKVIDMQTPLERLLGETPDYTFLKVFGCACWPHLRPYNNCKLQFRSKQCVFLGYSSLHKGYKCLHIPTNRVYISRDVVFDETIFPFSQTSSSSFPPLSSPPSTNPGQFFDVAYTPLLLANHCAGLGRGARLELLDDTDDTPGTNLTPPPCGAAPAADPRSPDIDRMGHAGEGSTLPGHVDHSPGSVSQAAHGPSSPDAAHTPGLATSTTAAMSSPSPTPTVPTSVGSDTPPPAPKGVVTRLQRGIRQQKIRTDGTVAWNVTRSSNSTMLQTEPTD
jgi:histone deacetylase 1/2